MRALSPSASPEEGQEVLFRPAPIPLPAAWWPHLAAGLLIAAELCWVTPWFRTVIVVSTVASPLRVASVLGAVMAIGYALSYTMEHFNIYKSLQRLALAALFFLSLFVSGQALLSQPLLRVARGIVDLDPGAVLVIFATLWLWGRGVTLGQEAIRPIVAWRRFVVGLLFLLAHLIIVSRLGQPSISLPFFALYLFLSLAAMIFARVAYVSLAHRVVKNPFDRRWLAGTLLLVAALVGAALFLGSLLTGQYTRLLDQLGEAAKWGIVVLMYAASLPWLLLTYLIGPLIPELQLRPTPTPSLPAEPGSLGEANPRLPPPEIPPLTPAMQFTFFWVIILGVVLLLILGRRITSRRSRTGGEDAESLLEKGDALRLLRKYLKEQFRKTASGLLGLARPARRLIAAARIRRIYSELLALCASLGTARKPSQTPHEFLPAMGELLPDRLEDLRSLTQAYVAVRYAEIPEDPAHLEALEEAWRRIQKDGRSLKLTRLAPLKTADVDEARRIKT